MSIWKAMLVPFVLAGSSVSQSSLPRMIALPAAALRAFGAPAALPPKPTAATAISADRQSEDHSLALRDMDPPPGQLINGRAEIGPPAHRLLYDRSASIPINWYSTVPERVAACQAPTAAGGRAPRSRHGPRARRRVLVDRQDPRRPLDHAVAVRAVGGEAHQIAGLELFAEGVGA